MREGVSLGSIGLLPCLKIGFVGNQLFLQSRLIFCWANMALIYASEKNSFALSS